VAVCAAAFVSSETAETALPTVKGTIASIEGTKVQITIQGDKADWVKKGAAVKFTGGLGKVLDVSATTLTINTKKASELKVGEEIVLAKGRAVPAGC
jgi:hypothetical protein